MSVERALGDSPCALCGAKVFGGAHTNGDGYGDAKHVGIDAGPYRFYCWACVETRRGDIPELSAVIDAAFAERGWCGFLKPWIGRCRNAKPCGEHASERCWSCGEPATSACSVAGSLVCGVPQCAAHPHVHQKASA